MPHCDNCFTALRHVLSSAFCQHLSALLFHRIQPAVMLHGNAFSAMPSAVISHGYEMGSEKKKKKSEEGSVEAALQWLHCWSRLIVFSSVATVNPSDGWLTCSFHLSSLLGSSPRSTASTAAPLGGTRTWKQKILEGHSVFKTFHTSPFRTFGCRHQYGSQFFFFSTAYVDSFQA